MDSSADFSKAEIEEKKLLFVPLQVTIEDKNYLDGIDIFTNEFYEKMIATDGFFKTSQPSPQQFLDHFQKAKENNDTLICVLISSALSGTIQSAILAKNIVEYDNIYIVDALTTTVGIRVMIDKAIEMIKEGKEAKETSGEKLEKGVATAPAGACRSGATPPLRISAQTPLFHLK